MLIFPNGLLQRKHEYILAVQIDVDVKGKDEPDQILHVLHNHNQPLQAIPSEVDFVVENLIQKLKKNLPKQNARIAAVNIVDLGPMKSAFNWENKRKYVDHGKH
jgi:hypothetical protein